MVLWCKALLQLSHSNLQANLIYLSLQCYVHSVLTAKPCEPVDGTVNTT